jgi:dTDP-4-dehydrorhamnose 3,5-epimerase
VELVDLERQEDERGWFARAWCAREFGERKLETRLAQVNLSFNRRAGTLRGMHYQAWPSEEAKLVRCLNGALHDVVVDLRPESPTHRRWVAVRLDDEARRAVYIPAGCAHGFQTLVDETEVLYLMSEFHDPAAAGGVRYDDPALAIAWPLPVSEISAKDQSWPLLAN